MGPSLRAAGEAGPGGGYVTRGSGPGRSLIFKILYAGILARFYLEAVFHFSFY